MRTPPARRARGQELQEEPDEWPGVRPDGGVEVTDVRRLLRGNGTCAADEEMKWYGGTAAPRRTP